jgi:hypothetical protein
MHRAAANGSEQVFWKKMVDDIEMVKLPRWPISNSAKSIHA